MYIRHFSESDAGEFVVENRKVDYALKNDNLSEVII